MALGPCIGQTLVLKKIWLIAEINEPVGILTIIFCLPVKEKDFSFIRNYILEESCRWINQNCGITISVIKRMSSVVQTNL